MNIKPRFPVGTLYITRHKAPKLCKVVDYHTTLNLDGDIVKSRYVSEHTLMGQVVTDSDVAEATVAMGVELLRSKG